MSRSVAKGSSAFRHIAGVCVTSRNVAKVSSDFRHTAGVCVISRSVAIISSDYRISNTEVKDPHCWSRRYKSQCGERLVRLSFQGQGYLGRRPLGK